MPVAGSVVGAMLAASVVAGLFAISSSPAGTRACLPRVGCEPASESGAGAANASFAAAGRRPPPRSGSRWPSSPRPRCSSTSCTRRAARLIGQASSRCLRRWSTYTDSSSRQVSIGRARGDRAPRRTADRPPPSIAPDAPRSRRTRPRDRTAPARSSRTRPATSRPSRWRPAFPSAWRPRSVGCTIRTPSRPRHLPLARRRSRRCRRRTTSRGSRRSTRSCGAWLVVSPSIPTTWSSFVSAMPADSTRRSARRVASRVRPVAAATRSKPTGSPAATSSPNAARRTSSVSSGIRPRTSSQQASPMPRDAPTPAIEWRSAWTPGWASTFPSAAAIRRDGPTFDGLARWP
jgi:hypothetical protein